MYIVDCVIMHFRPVAWREHVNHYTIGSHLSPANLLHFHKENPKNR